MIWPSPMTNKIVTLGLENTEEKKWGRSLPPWTNKLLERLLYYDHFLNEKGRGVTSEPFTIDGDRATFGTGRRKHQFQIRVQFSVVPFVLQRCKVMYDRFWRVLNEWQNYLPITPPRARSRYTCTHSVHSTLKSQKTTTTTIVRLS